jgi:hypothetical protein
LTKPLRKHKFPGGVYNNETVNMLYSVPLPLYSGYSNMMQNFGEYRNRGVEFTLGTNLSDRAFKWSSDFNISFNRSTVVNLPGSDVFAGNSPLNNVTPFILSEGETTNAFYGYVYDGVYQEGVCAEPAKLPGFQIPSNGRDANCNRQAN